MHLRIVKWGNSLAVRLPADIARAASLRGGDEVEALVTAAGEITLRPTRQFDKVRFLGRLTKLHAKMQRQTESAARFVRRMREGDY